MNFCKDCRWSDTTWWQRLWNDYPTFLRCNHSESFRAHAILMERGPVNLVNESLTSQEPAYCSMMRLPHQACGHNGKLFEKRDA